MSVSFFSFSISANNTERSFRQRIAFSKNEISDFYKRIKSLKLCYGCVLLCTCNRTELYFSAEEKNLLTIKNEFANAKSINTQELEHFLINYIDEQAIKHLFYVASGLDSLILGENQILFQIKEAYKYAQEKKMLDFYTNTIFQAALNAAKAIKTQTPLAKTSTSLATLCVNHIMHFREKEKLTNCSVLLIGASGSTGNLILKDLLEREQIQVYATIRNQQIKEEAKNLFKIQYSQRYSYLDSCDVIISVTSNPDYTLCFNQIKENLKTNKKRFFIDLAVPADIDCAILNLEQIQLENIDDFRTIVSKNESSRINGVKQAESIIQEKLSETQKLILFHENKDLIDDFLLDNENQSASKLFYLFRNLSNAEQFKVLLELCKKYYSLKV